MICKYSGIEQELVWDEDNYIRELVVEQPRLFREIMTSFFQDEEQKLCITQDGQPLDLSNDVELIVNPCHLDFTNKKIITNLWKKISEVAIGESFYLSSNQLTTNICQYLHQLTAAENLDFMIEMDEITVGQLLKAANLRPVSIDGDLATTIIDYMNVERELAGTKLFVFVNLRSFLMIDELKLLCQEVNNRQMFTLLWENAAQTALDGLPRLLVDQDWCEI